MRPGQRSGKVSRVALKPSATGGPAIQNVNPVALGGPIEVTSSRIGTPGNPVELR